MAFWDSNLLNSINFYVFNLSFSLKVYGMNVEMRYFSMLPNNLPVYPLFWIDFSRNTVILLIGIKEGITCTPAVQQGFTFTALKVLLICSMVSTEHIFFKISFNLYLWFLTIYKIEFFFEIVLYKSIPYICISVWEYMCIYISICLSESDFFLEAFFFFSQFIRNDIPEGLWRSLWGNFHSRYSSLAPRHQLPCCVFNMQSDIHY